jgi:hypothetical protein
MSEQNNIAAILSADIYQSFGALLYAEHMPVGNEYLLPGKLQHLVIRLAAVPVAVAAYGKKSLVRIIHTQLCQIIAAVTAKKHNVTAPVFAQSGAHCRHISVTVGKNYKFHIHPPLAGKLHQIRW